MSSLRESDTRMSRIIEQHREELEKLCRTYRVVKLYAFGSATSDRFSPDTSDIDFLVLFAPMTPFEHADAYFGLIESLEKLYQRPVDLIEDTAIRNPYFRKEVEETRIMLYAA